MVIKRTGGPSRRQIRRSTRRGRVLRRSKPDRIRIKGHTTDFQDTITSMQEENNPVEKAVPGQMIGIKVKERVREHDIVYKVT